MAKNNKYEILPSGEMQKKYGLYVENREVLKLDHGKVPKELRHLIPLAERWGEGDDIIRDDMVKKATSNDRRLLKKAVFDHADMLNAWLAGPEANSRKFSKEYIAFSCMRMAADTIPD